MSNIEARQILANCKDELNVIKKFINEDKFNSKNPYLVKYCVIRVSGSIETAFKTIVADAFDFNATEKVRNFVEKEIRESSKNPSYSNMCSLLKKIDNSWNEKFKESVNEEKRRDTSLLSSLESLNEARNSFAHGKNTTVTMDGVLLYFEKASKIIEILDSVVKNDDQVLINKIEREANSVESLKDILLSEPDFKSLINTLLKYVDFFSKIDNLTSALCLCLEDENFVQDNDIEIIKFITNSLPLIDPTQRLGFLIDLHSSKLAMNLNALLFNSLKSLQYLSNDILKSQELEILGESISSQFLMSLSDPDSLMEYSRVHAMMILEIITIYHYEELLQIITNWNQIELNIGKLIMLLCDENDATDIRYRNLENLKIFDKVIELSKQKYQEGARANLDEYIDYEDIYEARRAIDQLLVATSQTIK
ncbi:HEPN domain-containing protein [Bacillus pumilus]|uniref:HEPN domain-containing protein n=1 Tax=Bacillus pumilus TaxID=1408 RepID=UPI0011A2CC11|nr:HEPN domain-containing protein [Bacillus pumilus]